MKILFVGVLDVDWSTNCSMKRALEDLGHIVVPFNYRTIANDSSFPAICSSMLLDRWADKATSFLRSDFAPLNLPWYYNRKNRRCMNNLLVDQVKKSKFDLVLLSKTDTVPHGITLWIVWIMHATSMQKNMLPMQPGQAHHIPTLPSISKKQAQEYIG
jgi:hypothetical protein